MLLLLLVLLIDDGGDKDATAAAVAAVGSADAIDGAFGCAVGGVFVACFVVHVHEYVNIAWNNLN